MFFLSFPPKIFPYCKKIALFSQAVGLSYTLSPAQVLCTFLHKIAAHWWAILSFISFHIPFSSDSKTLRAVQTLRYFSLSWKLSVLSSFPPLPFSLLLFIRSDNKTKWELTAQLVFNSQMFAEDQMRHFVQSGSPSKFRIVSPSTALSRSADAAFYSLFPLWFQHLNSMFWQFGDPYSCSTLIYEI